jgi:uncharacterized membrane protein
MDPINIIGIIFASIFVLFLPGAVLSFVFFEWGKIDLIERLALSFALSIAVVPLIAFYANLMGIPIRRESVFVEVLLIVMAGLLGIMIKRELRLRKKAT